MIEISEADGYLWLTTVPLSRNTARVHCCWGFGGAQPHLTLSFHL
jgi:hypothetical protein